MSTIKVNNIDPPNVGEGVSIDGLQMPTAGALSNRNLIINGAMQVAQRGTSVAMATAAVFCTDRFKAVQGSSFNWQSTLTQENDGPSGFSKSLKVNVDTASTPTGSHNAVFYYRLEGQDCQSLGYGTSDARTTTLSFWVKSNKTGTYSVQFANNNPSKYLLVEYSINSADTWEYKTMSFAGDTASTVDNDNDIGLDVRWNLAAGSTDLAAPTNTWVSTGGIRASNDQVNLMDTVNNYWQFTGLQLEVGSKATPFEHKRFSEELRDCNRYFEKSYDYSTPPGTVTNAGMFGLRKSNISSSILDINLNYTRKRIFPTVIIYSPQTGASGKARNDTVDITAQGTDIGENNCRVTGTTASANRFISAHYTADAEL
jgi:hypothetical protein